MTIAAAFAPSTLPPYRSEAFVEDLDLLPQPFEVDEPHARGRSLQRVAAWLLAVPGTVALLAGAVVIATLPT
jgi:hypothetical protein